MTGPPSGPKPAHVGPTPAVQVVGFHVEGHSPSPAQPSILNDSVPVGAGSPTPVIIPPSFQSGINRLDSGPQVSLTRTSVEPVIARPLDAVNPVAGSSSIASAAPANAGSLRLAEGAHVPSGPSAASVTAPGTSSSSSSTLPIKPSASSNPQAISHPEKAEAAHAGLAKLEEASSVTSELSTLSTLSEMMSTSTTSPRPAGAMPAAAAGPPPGSSQPDKAAAAAAAAAPSTAAPAGKGSSGGAKPAPQAAAAGAAAAGPGGPPAEKKAPATRAERRALQEAQRAAKAAAKGEGPPAKGGAPEGGKGGKPGPAAGAGAPAAAPPPQDKALQRTLQHTSSAKSVEALERRATLDSAVAADGPQPGPPGAAPAAKPKKATGGKVVSLASTELFAHLQQYNKVTVQTLLRHKEARNMHPAVLQLGLRYADGTVSGANARCMAMLHAFCQVIRDYSTPEGKSLSRDLTSQLNSIINFLVECRPLSVSMGNAIKFIKLRISKIDPYTPEAEAKEELLADIQDFINTRIMLADKLLVAAAVTKVDAGDVVLTYAYSSVVAEVLVQAAAQGQKFRALVVDCRPELEGRLMLQKLLQAGIACTYVQLNALSYAIREVSKVFLGAAAVMSNGTVMGRSGSAAVAMMAHAHGKPVMICCESYKFHERVQLDSITHNELGNPEALASVPGRPDIKSLSNHAEQPRLGLLNLKYDAMPADYVTMIVTEFGMIPPTSVPVILREYRQES